jgi:hypothetical protein
MSKSGVRKILNSFLKKNFVKNPLKFLAKIVVPSIIYVIFALISRAQFAEAQIIDSSFYQWQVYEIQENELDYKRCYIVSHPVKSDSNHNSRQKPYLMIARFQKDRSEEVSIFSGFEYKLNSEVFILVDDNQFKLLAKNDIAWAKTKTEDIKIIEVMLQSAILKVRSDSAVGTYAVDEYSLEGITKAYQRMKEICW